MNRPEEILDTHSLDEYINELAQKETDSQIKASQQLVNDSIIIPPEVLVDLTMSSSDTADMSGFEDILTDTHQAGCIDGMYALRSRVRSRRIEARDQIWSGVSDFVDSASQNRNKILIGVAAVGVLSSGFIVDALDDDSISAPEVVTESTIKSIGSTTTSTTVPSTTSQALEATKNTQIPTTTTQISETTQVTTIAVAPETTIAPTQDSVGVSSMMAEFQGSTYDCNGVITFGEIPNLWPAIITDICDSVNGDDVYDMQTLVDRNYNVLGEAGVEGLDLLRDGQKLNLGLDLPDVESLGLKQPTVVVSTQPEQETPSNTSVPSQSNIKSQNQPNSSLQEECPSLGGTWKDIPVSGMYSYFEAMNYGEYKVFLTDAFSDNYGINDGSPACIPNKSVVQSTLRAAGLIQ